MNVKMESDGAAQQAADTCFREAASAPDERRADAWREAGCHFFACVAARQHHDPDGALSHWQEGREVLRRAGLSLEKLWGRDVVQPWPPVEPEAEEVRMVGLCSLRAQALRQRADRATPLQTERAVTEYGAAAALERAAHLWAAGLDTEAQSWMRAAENTLLAALVPLPWTPGT